MTCDRCLDIVINPVEHEFCRVISNGEHLPLTGIVLALLYDVVTKGNLLKNLPPPPPLRYIPPKTQGSISHDFANKGAKPAIKLIEFGEEMNDNPAVSLATRIHEG